MSDLLPRPLRRLLMSPVVRLVLSVIVGILIGLLTALAATVTVGLAVLVGITATGVVFVGAGLLVLWPMDGYATRRSARSEVLRPLADELVVAVAALIGLVGAILPQLLSRTAEGLPAAICAVAAVFLCWAGLHLMYATRYADVYYDEERGGGISFRLDQDPDREAGEGPCYRDFLYLSFGVGMTYGITDTDVSSTAVRSIVLRHAVLSFVFGTVILASVVGVVTGVLGS
jgi:uncharacterized membrane protein